MSSNVTLVGFPLKPNKRWGGHGVVVLVAASQTQKGCDGKITKMTTKHRPSKSKRVIVFDKAWHNYPKQLFFMDMSRTSMKHRQESRHDAERLVQFGHVMGKSIGTPQTWKNSIHGRPVDLCWSLTYMVILALLQAIVMPQTQLGLFWRNHSVIVMPHKWL